MIDIKITCYSKNHRSKADLMDRFSVIGMTVDVHKDHIVGWGQGYPDRFSTILIKVLADVPLTRCELDIRYL